MTEKVSGSAALELIARELKKARMERELSIEDISRLITVQKNYVEKIEEGEFGFLSGAYVFAYLKKYAQHVGVGDADTLERCRKELQLSTALKGDGAAGRSASERVAPPQKNLTIPRLRLRRSRRLLFAGAAALLLLFGALYLFGSAQVASRPSPPPPSYPAAVAVDDTVAVAEQIVDSLVTTPPVPAPAPAPSVPVQPKPLSLKAPAPVKPPAPKTVVVPVPVVSDQGSAKWKDRISFSPASPNRKVLVVHILGDNSWVKVIADDSSQVYAGAQFKSGQVLRYEARRKFWVNIGRPGNVEIFLNGKKLQPTTSRILILD